MRSFSAVRAAFCLSYGTWIVDISRFTSAGKLFISDRNPLCCAWHFLVAFEKKSKEMFTTRTNVVVHPCGDVTFAHVT